MGRKRREGISRGFGGDEVVVQIWRMREVKVRFVGREREKVMLQCLIDIALQLINAEFLYVVLFDSLAAPELLCAPLCMKLPWVLFLSSRLNLRMTYMNRIMNKELPYILHILLSASSPNFPIPFPENGSQHTAGLGES